MARVKEWSDVRAEMARAGVSQAQVAPLLGLTRTHWNILVGSDEWTRPNPDVIDRIMDAIDAAKNGIPA